MSASIVISQNVELQGRIVGGIPAPSRPSMWKMRIKWKLL